MLLPAILAILPAERGTLLDLGCGNGWLSEQYRLAGFDVTAVDRLADGLSYGRAAFPAVRFAVGDVYESLGGPFAASSRAKSSSIFSPRPARWRDASRRCGPAAR